MRAGRTTVVQQCIRALHRDLFFFSDAGQSTGSPFRNDRWRMFCDGYTLVEAVVSLDSSGREGVLFVEDKGEEHSYCFLVVGQKGGSL